MGHAAEKVLFSVADYLQREAGSEIKHEYMDGEIVAMAGGDPQHSLIGNNISGELRSLLKGRTCRAYNSDLQVATSRYRYVYPDATVICGPLTSFDENPLAANNPVVIFEVTSVSTESYDRGQKFMRYRQMPTLKEYVLVSQERPYVEVFSRQENELWKISSYVTLTEIVRLSSLEVDLPMAEIYAGVEALLNLEDTD